MSDILAIILCSLITIGLVVFLFGVPIAMHQSEKWFEKEREEIYKDIFQLNDRIAKLEQQAELEERGKR